MINQLNFSTFRGIIMRLSNITLPEGYSAHGLEDLNFSVDNAASSFVSEATALGNVITINVTKTYKKVQNSQG